MRFIIQSVLQFLDIVWREIRQKDNVCTVNKWPAIIMSSCYIVASCTSLIQGMKEATRVKTVGFWGVLHPRPSTKLVTPCTYHWPSLPWQFRGPPESPWKRMDGRLRSNGTWCCLFKAEGCVTIAHMACWLALSSCTDHCRLCWASPPVTLTTSAVIHRRKQGLLERSCPRTSGWRGLHINTWSTVDAAPHNEGTVDSGKPYSRDDPSQ